MKHEIYADILTIGDEILIGQITDTNSQWMSEKLNEIGVKIREKKAISDTKEAIQTALEEALKYSNIILITGGLGPTKDDITKVTLANFFGVSMVRNKEVLASLEKRYADRKKVLTKENATQADVPENCNVLMNAMGTAPGMLFKHKGKIIISMPGVPYEMKHLMETHVLPLLSSSFSLPSIVHKTARTISIPESELMMIVKDWEENLPKNIKLAYLPRYNQVRMRLSAFGQEEEVLKLQIEEQFEKLKDILGNNIFGFDNDELHQVIGDLLIKKGLTLSSAESCTGGMIGQMITSISGASNYYKGGVIAYANEVKRDLLDVSQEVLNNHGAVSEPCIIAMAEGVRNKLNTDIGVATSGIAGPSGATSTKPVGTIWVAIATADKTYTKLLHLTPDRSINIPLTTGIALDLIRRTLLEK